MCFRKLQKKYHQGKPFRTAAVIGIPILALVLCCVILCWLNRFTVQIHLNGEPDLTLEFGDSYEEQGAKAYLSGKFFLKNGVELDVAIQGIEDMQLGTHQVQYQARFLCWAEERTRTVHVQDTVAPKITLNYEKGSYTLPGHEYMEEGFSAADNHDGDVTDRVLCSEKDGFVYYQVEDSSGNLATARRRIYYHDPISPELILTGGSEMEWNIGEPFTEPGFSAVDNCDGDLTAGVQVTGDVNVYCSGSYVLHYEVSDRYGNEASVDRTVHVKALPQPETVYPGGKVIYLTFDDGPSVHTQRLLQILAKYQVKATFFVVNTGNMDILRDMVAQGHSVGMHSVTHDYRSIYASEEAYFADLHRIQQIILDKTGIKSTLLRFPGGSSNTVSAFNPGIMTRLTRAVTDAGLQYFDWNVSSGDAGLVETADEVYENVIGGIWNQSAAVVLQHDSKGFSVDAVERIILWGLRNGYRFQALQADSPKSHHGVNN